jgi:hypothetical protein
MVCALYDGKVVGDYTFFPTPIMFDGYPYYFMVNCYPTGEAFFFNDIITCIDTIEMSWQYFKATAANM